MKIVVTNLSGPYVWYKDFPNKPIEVSKIDSSGNAVIYWQNSRVVDKIVYKGDFAEIMGDESEKTVLIKNWVGVYYNAEIDSDNTARVNGISENNRSCLLVILDGFYEVVDTPLNNAKILLKKFSDSLNYRKNLVREEIKFAYANPTNWAADFAKDYSFDGKDSFYKPMLTLTDKINSKHFDTLNKRESYSDYMAAFNMIFANKFKETPKQVKPRYRLRGEHSFSKTYKVNDVIFFSWGTYYRCVDVSPVYYGRYKWERCK